MKINTEYVQKSLKVLEKSYSLLLAQKNSIEYEIYRNSTKMTTLHIAPSHLNNIKSIYSNFTG